MTVAEWCIFGALMLTLLTIAPIKWIGFRSFDNAKPRDPAFYAERSANKWETAPPSGESYAALAARVKTWYASVTRDTVVAAHGGTTRALMVITGVAKPEDAADAPIQQGAVYVFANGALNKYS